MKPTVYSSNPALPLDDILFNVDIILDRNLSLLKNVDSSDLILDRLSLLRKYARIVVDMAIISNVLDICFVLLLLLLDTSACSRLNNVLDKPPPPALSLLKVLSSNVENRSLLWRRFLTWLLMAHPSISNARLLLIISADVDEVGDTAAA